MTEQSPLTERQTEVLALLAKGMTYQAIADIQARPRTTVAGEGQRALIRLGASTQAEAVAIAIRAGWI